MRLQSEEGIGWASLNSGKWWAVAGLGGRPGRAVMADLGAIKRKGVTRRRFMGDVLKTACGMGVSMTLSELVDLDQP